MEDFPQSGTTTRKVIFLSLAFLSTKILSTAFLVEFQIKPVTTHFRTDVLSLFDKYCFNLITCSLSVLPRQQPLGTLLQGEVHNEYIKRRRHLSVTCQANDNQYIHRVLPSLVQIVHRQVGILWHMSVET